MRSVKIKTSELLEVLRRNRKEHVQDFNESYAQYIKEATQQLKKMYETAKNDLKIKKSIDLVEPKSYEESYNTAILMLEMSSDNVVELTHSEFTQYVEDKWSWKESFTNTTAMYKS